MGNQHRSVESRVEDLAPQLRNEARRSALGLPALRTEAFVRVHHGWYLDREAWEALDPIDRHLARVLAVHLSARTPPVFSHASAAILLGFSMHTPDLHRVHVTVGAGGSRRSSGTLVRHLQPLPDDAVTTRAGLRCTAEDRTILDLCRSMPPETALSFADSFVRSVFRVERLIDTARFEHWQSRMQRKLESLRGAPGVRAARHLLSLVDPRKDSVLESLSHLQLDRLGFEVALQVPVMSPTDGVNYLLDFELLGLGVFGECDGAVKYADPRMLSGLTPEQRVYREKRRDEWIHGVTGHRVVHWGYAEAVRADRLARRLAAFGVPLPHRTW